MKVESAAIAILTLCIFLTFYFSFLSLQSLDETIKKQLVTLAIYSILTGIIILTSLIIHIGVKKALTSIETQLRSHENEK
ncbi:MAG: hypothetical protein ACUVTB_07335 [Candidatus Bathycorpusculaceae bacterium]